MEAFERVRFLRKNLLHITLQEFADKINISRSNLGNIETGKINLTERVATDICREFFVNESWLMQGVEPVFEENKNPLDLEISRLYALLTDDHKKYLYGYIQRLIEEQMAEEK